MKEQEIFGFVKNKLLQPIYASTEASGADLCADLAEDRVIAPGESYLIPTGVRLQIPRGYEVQIRPRSGLALHHQVTVLNSPGTIDSDYRGEIQVILINHGRDPFTVTPKMRIAQLVLSPVARARFTWLEMAEMLESTKRGEGGFGHTGI